MIACSLIELEREEHERLHEYWRTMAVSRIWMSQYVSGREDGMPDGLMIACRPMQLEREEHERLHEPCSAMCVSRT